jgi:hypothetical protein
MGHVSSLYLAHQINNLIHKPILQGLDKILAICKGAASAAPSPPKKVLSFRVGRQARRGTCSYLLKLTVNQRGELIGVFHAVFGYVSPNLGEIGRRSRAYNYAWHLLAAGSCSCLKPFAAFAFHFGRIPWAGGTTVQALLNIVPQLLQLRSAQLIFCLHQAQGLTYHLAGGVVAA